MTCKPGLFKLPKPTGGIRIQNTHTHPQVSTELQKKRNVTCCHYRSESDIRETHGERVEESCQMPIQTRTHTHQISSIFLLHHFLASLLLFLVQLPSSYCTCATAPLLFFFFSGLIGISSEKEDQKEIREIIMSRQSPSRNQRSKGIKIKKVLQICLLVAICIWLIYQVKHSHDRKKEFDESDEKVLLRRGGTNDMLKLGRKDLHSQVEEIFSKNAEHDAELEEEEEEEEDKNEEYAQGEKSIRGNENEGLGGEEEEEIDEQERENLETQIDREEDFVDNEDGEDSDDQENEEKYSEDSKTDVSVEDGDRDGDDRSSHEAREEHYKADDASSAVTHDTQIDRENSSEHLDLVLGKEKKERNSEETNTSENRKELGVENGEMAKGSNGSDVTVKETLLGNYQNYSFSNNTQTEGSHHRSEVNNSSTEVRLGYQSSSLGNITESFSDNSINGSISSISAETKGMDSKSEEFSSASNDSDSFESVKIKASEASMDSGDCKNEIFDSRMPEILEEVEHDPIDFSDTSNSLEDEDVPANLDTLLHGIWKQGTHAKEAAAE